MVRASIEGLASATGYNNTQGITIGGSVGFGAGIGGGGVSLVQTRKPDGSPQFNLMWSGSSTTAGWDFGASGNIGADSGSPWAPSSSWSA